MATAVMYQNAKTAMANNAFYDLDNAATKIRVIFLNSTHAVNHAHAVVDDIVANVANGTTLPYGTTGETDVWNLRPEIDTKTLSDAGTNNVDLDGNPVVLSLGTTAHGNIRHVVAYIENVSDLLSPLLCSWDLGADKNLKTDDITLAISGIVRF